MTRIILSTFATLLVIGTSCYHEDDPSSASLKITSTINGKDVNSIEADGVSTIPIDVTVTGSNDPISRDVVITTTVGTFDNNTASITVKTDLKGVARVYLKSAIADSTRVRASLADISFHHDFLFTRAAPETIILNTDVLQASPGTDKPLTVNAMLRRSVGKVSSGYLLIYEASTNKNKFDDSTTLGTFTASTPSGDDGTTSVKFAIKDTSFDGDVYFRAKLGGSETTMAVYGPVYFKK